MSSYLHRSTGYLPLLGETIFNYHILEKRGGGTGWAVHRPKSARFFVASFGMTSSGSSIACSGLKRNTPMACDQHNKREPPTIVVCIRSTAPARLPDSRRGRNAALSSMWLLKVVAPMRKWT